MVIIIVSCLIWGLIVFFIRGSVLDGVLSAIFVLCVVIPLYKDYKKDEVKDKELEYKPNNLMLRKLQKIADETVKEVLQEYFRNVRNPEIKDVYEATVGHYFEESSNESINHLKSNIEGLCILVAMHYLPKDIMAFRFAQFCGYINIALNRNNLRPRTTIEDLLMDYELLGLKEVYDLNPELFCIDRSCLKQSESNIFEVLEDEVESDTGVCNDYSYEDEFDYIETAEGIVITKYKEHSDVVVIPTEIRGKIVIGIAEAFKSNETIIEVYLQEGIRFIAPRSFENAVNLKKVHFSDSLEEIGEYAFAGCISMNSLTFRDGLTIIGKYAFSNCRSIEYIDIFPPIIKIEEGVFENCTNLHMVYIGEGVSVIGDYAFNNCLNIEFLSTPKESLIYIGKSAFENCQKVGIVDYCEGLQEVGDNAFKNCKSIRHFEFPENFRKLGENAFEGCISLISISWFCDMELNLNHAFKNCPNLKYKGCTELDL